MYYVCFIIDLWNREIVGVSVSDKHDSACVLEAIENMTVPISNYEMFLSYRVGEFTSISLQSLLAELKIEISISNSGCPFDNAVSENVFKLAKPECLKSYYKNVNDLYTDIDKWVKWYNNVRLHSKLGSKSPSQLRYEQAAQILYSNTIN